MEPRNIQDASLAQEPLAEDEMVAANRSLADALRLSFVLLSVGMVIVLIAFLASGFTLVRSSEIGVKLFFGRIVGEGNERIVGEGLCWSWPEPIGRVEKIPTATQVIKIDDFWMYERPEEVDTPLAERTPQSPGLRPGFDGALLTGDRALVHVKLVCNFQMGTRNEKPDAVEAVNYLTHIGDSANAREVVRSAVIEASVQAAASMTVERILITGQKSKRDSFTDTIMFAAQKRLDDMKAGIQILEVQKGLATAPLAVIPARNKVTSARQQQTTMLHHARTGAIGILNDAAGDAWPELVGDPARAGSTGKAISAEDRWGAFGAYLAARKNEDETEAEKQREIIRRFGLLKLYADALDDDHETRADQILAEIHDVLSSSRCGGQAAQLINDATGYRGSIAQEVAASVHHFEELLAKYEKSPELMIQRLWTEAKLDILTRSGVEKFLITPGQRTVLKIGRDPGLVRQRKKAALEAAVNKETGAKQWSPPTPPKPSSPPEH